LNTDQNDGDPIGIGLIPSSTRKGLRTTGASAFLEQHKPANLNILPETVVVKVLFDGKQAVGVQTGTGQKSKCMSNPSPLASLPYL
jgi:hypothetical protein